MKKKLLLAFVSIFLIGLCYKHNANQNMIRSDAYIRNRVLQLRSREGSCSAIEVKAPSGDIYTLSAAHCSVLLQDGTVEAMNEQDTSKRLRMLKIDYEHDLMLLEAFDKKSINVADNVYKHEHVHVIAHGRGYPSYRVDGELLVEQIIHIGEPLNSQAQRDYCEKLPDHDIEISLFGEVCLFSLNEMQSSAVIQPGASGGPVLDYKGSLVGIVSSGDGVFSGFIPLHDIHDFLRSE